MTEQTRKSRRTAPDRSGKINIGVLIDSELWKRFKIQCLQEGRKEGEQLSEMIAKYLDQMNEKK